MVDAAGRGDIPRMLAAFVGMWNGVLPANTRSTSREAEETRAAPPGSIIPPEAVRLLTIAAELATAETEEEFEAALDVIAAPIGSTDQKLQGFHLSLGGLVGIAAGLQYVPSTMLDVAGGPQQRIPASDSAYLAPMLSLGIDVTMGAGDVYAGLFLNVLDFGSILTLSDPFSAFTTDSTSLRRCSGDGDTGCIQREDFEPLRFVAPGAFVHFGFRGMSWLTFGAGVVAQPFGERLNSFGVMAADNAAPSATNELWVIRALGFVAVDVPIIFF